MATILNIQCYRNEQVIINFTVDGRSNLDGIPFTWKLTEGPGGPILYTMNRDSGNISNTGGDGLLIIPHEATNRSPATYNYALSTSSPYTMLLEGEFEIQPALTE